MQNFYTDKDSDYEELKTERFKITKTLVIIISVLTSRAQCESTC